jgi:FkbM family methyltransferase
MKYLLNRIEVYTLYLLEYIKHGEWGALGNAFRFMFSRKSFWKGGRIQTSMGVFDTRPQSLDFQYVNYAYEIHIKRFIEKEPFDVFMDIGACLGEYSVWLGQKGKRCFAFEPVKASYDMIDRNIQLNKVGEQVKAFNYGLGLKHSLEYFEMDVTNPGSNRRVDKPGAHTERFEINALDDVIGALGLSEQDRILIKIDVEGMELEMLNGGAKFLQRFPHIVLIIEEKFSGESNIRNGLSQIARFEYGKIDEHNIYARKTGNL